MVEKFVGGGGGASLVLLPHFIKFQGGGGGRIPLCPPPHPKQSPELDGQSIGIILSQ